MGPLSVFCEIGWRSVRLTKRAADKWDSARFSSLFLALGFFRPISRVLARPLAANADRWAHSFIFKIGFLFLEVAVFHL